MSADLQELWEGVDDETLGTQTIPDGLYNVKVQEAGINSSRMGRLQMTIRVSVADGDFKGRSLFYNSGMDNKEAIWYTKTTLKILGMDIPKNTKDLPKVLETMKGVHAVIRARTKGEYQNIYFQQSKEPVQSPKAQPSSTTKPSPKPEKLKPAPSGPVGRVVSFSSKGKDYVAVITETNKEGVVVKSLSEVNHGKKLQLKKGAYSELLTLVGSSVSFQVDDETIEGTVTADCLEGMFEVTDADGTIWEDVSVEELTVTEVVEETE